jgi:ribosome-associated translation inhibitor RaiA
MIIQLNTDRHFTGRQDVTDLVEGIVGDNLDHFTSQITRVEVHIGDVNAHKGGGDDIRCSMEARLEGHPPLAVENRAGSIEEAVDGAAGKLKRHLEHTLGRLHDKRMHDQ